MPPYNIFRGESMAKKILFQKKVGNSLESIYPKTSSDITIYNESTGETVKSKIDSIVSKEDNLIRIGTCATAAGEKSKIVTCANFVLYTGAIIAVKFTYTNTFSATTTDPITLNVNSTGAKNIYYGNTATPTGTNTIAFGTANYYNFYIYDGSYWVWINRSIDTNTTYSNASLGNGYATCDTAESTTAKVAAFVNGTYSLVTNGIVSVKFTYAVPANATLNIDSKGAKAIYFNGAAITAGIINAGDTVTFFYDNTKYNIVNIMHDRPNMIYWGGGAGDATINATFITGLSNSEKIEDRKKDSFSVSLSANQYLYIAIPSAITNPIISLFGFVTECTKVGTSIAVSGVNYDVYRAPHAVTTASTYIAKIE